MVVVFNPIVIDPRVITDPRWIVGQQEHKDTAAVVVGIILIDLGVGAVLDLDAGDIVENLVVPHRDRSTTLPDINCCVRNPADDIMLNYQTTSFHDTLYLRKVLGLKAAPEFEIWLKKMNIMDENGVVQAVKSGHHMLQNMPKHLLSAA